jgi:hypothetical protein
LLKTIKRFLKEENKDGVILDISRRFFHVDLLLANPMQEGIFDIHLMDLHLCEVARARTRWMEFILAMRGKCFIIVNSFNLRETFGN